MLNNTFSSLKPSHLYRRYEAIKITVLLKSDFYCVDCMLFFCTQTQSRGGMQTVFHLKVCPSSTKIELCAHVHYNFTSFEFCHTLVNMSLVYDSSRLYEDGYNTELQWEKWLPHDVYKFHYTTYREINSPVSLQMGIMLPFIASCCGPRTKGRFLTRPSVINLFWINVAASGTGKSQARKRLVSEPLEYLISNTSHELQDFEVCRFTRAGNLILI